MAWEEDVRDQRTAEAKKEVLAMEAANERKAALLSFWDKLINLNDEISADVRLEHKIKKIFIPHQFYINKRLSAIVEDYKDGGHKDTLGPLVLFNDNSVIGIRYGHSITPKTVHIGEDPILEFNYYNGCIGARCSHAYGPLDSDHKIRMFLRNLCSNRPWWTGIVSKPKGKGCFIATACYGSYDAPEVVLLRAFRDNTLERSFIGRAFIKTYYACSPPIASFIGGSESLRGIVRSILDSIIGLISRKGAAR